VPRISLEPRKTTWVRFIDQTATMDVERTCDVAYASHNVLSNMDHGVDMRYLFSGLKGDTSIPSSQLIIKERGISLGALLASSGPVVEGAVLPNAVSALNQKIGCLQSF